MLSWTLPASLTVLLARFPPCFTAPTFTTFTWLCCGFLAQTGRRTVTGMLTGARLARVWSHHRAHRFFSRACWQADQLGLLLADLIVEVLLAPGASVRLVVDDSLSNDDRRPPASMRRLRAACRTLVGNSCRCSGLTSCRLVGRARYF